MRLTLCLSPRVLLRGGILMLLAGCASETDFKSTLPAPPVEEESPPLPPLFEEEEPLPDVPRIYFFDMPTAPAMADDGTVLMNDHRSNGDVYLWTEAQGMEWVTTTGAWFNGVNDISADGKVIVGEYGDYTIGETTQAATWTRNAGWTKLGALPDTLDCPMQSAGYSVTDDGSQATGLAFSGCSGRAFHWAAGGQLVPLETLGSGGNRATRISADGSTMVGFAQGNTNRSPALWFDNGNGVLLDARFTGEFHDVNADGSLAVGQLGSKAFTWTPDDGHTVLDTLGDPGASASTALAICGGNDELLVGSDTLAGGTAFVWTDDDGIAPLHDFFDAAGLEVPGDMHLMGATACNPDLTHFVGWGSDGDIVGTWVAIFPSRTIHHHLSR